MMELPPEIESAVIALADTKCLAESDDEMQYICNLDLHHPGPWHIAYDDEDKEVARWLDQ